MTGEPTIDYDALALEAMRGLVRTVLQRAAKSGLPGDHHFYVSFDTEAPSVTLSRRLKERYPREMTIVLQHRFWDLAVHDDRFEVKLTFDGIPERLVVPFTAIKVFFDPSVQYGLRFEEAEAPETGEVTAPPAGASGPRPVTTRTGGSKKPKPLRKTKGERDGLVAISSNPAPAANPGTHGANAPVPITRTPAMAPVASAPSPPPAAARSETAADTPAGNDAKPANSGAQILSLDQFRKK